MLLLSFVFLFLSILRLLLLFLFSLICHFLAHLVEVVEHLVVFVVELLVSLTLLTFIVLLAFSFFLMSFLLHLLFLLLFLLLFGLPGIDLAGDAVEEIKQIIVEAVLFGHFAVFVLARAHSQLLLVQLNQLIVFCFLHSSFCLCCLLFALWFQRLGCRRVSLHLMLLCVLLWLGLVRLLVWVWFWVLFDDGFALVGCAGRGAVVEVVANAFLLGLLLLPACLLPGLASSGWGCGSLRCGRPHFNNLLSGLSFIVSMRVGRVLALAGALGCWGGAVSPSPEPPLYQMIRGEYEDRIRRYSPPEKIFNVFSLRNEEERSVLSLQGLLQAICFYNYSETGSHDPLEGFDSSALRQLLGKEGEFEIYDYFLFAHFLAFGRERVEAFMRGRGVDELDRAAFTDMLLNHVCADYDALIRENLGLESRQFKPSKEDFLRTVMRAAESMFARTDAYSLPDFLAFRRALMKQLYAYEFRCFRGQAAIDGVDFARSIVKYATNNQKRKLLRRVRAIEPGVEAVRVTEKEYVDFHFELQANMERIKKALETAGVITRPEIMELLRAKGDQISEGQVEVFFRLLDTDDSGFIEKREVLGVIESLGYYWNVRPGQQSLQQLLEARWGNLCAKAQRIQEILLEE